MSEHEEVKEREKSLSTLIIRPTLVAAFLDSKKRDEEEPENKQVLNYLINPWPSLAENQEK